MKIATLLATAALALALPMAAHAQAPCSKETLTVRDTPVAIGYCVSGAPVVNGPEITLTVAATYSTPGGSLSKTSTMKFIQGAGPARLLQSVELDGLGMTGTLHLTLSYTAGIVRIENALLTPGAITIK